MDGSRGERGKPSGFAGGGCGSGVLVVVDLFDGSDLDLITTLHTVPVVSNFPVPYQSSRSTPSIPQNRDIPGEALIKQVHS